jgi:hypothetical protein
MTDFETHPRGTAQELMHLRALISGILLVEEQNPGTMPSSVMNLCNATVKFYEKQLKLEAQE